MPALPPAPPPVVHQIEITAAVGNICHLPLMPIQNVRSDVSTLRSMAGNAEYLVAMGSEIGQRDGYAKAWASGMTGMRTVGRQQEVPVSLSRDIHVDHVRLKRLTHGVAHLSPDRWVTKVRTTIAGFKVAVLNSHSVSASKNPRADRLPVRKALFATWRHKMRHTIHRLVRKGWTVIAGGDFNSPWPVSLDRHQVVIQNRDMMQLLVVPTAGIKVRKLGSKVARGYTDHVMVAETIGLVRSKS